MSQYFPKPYKSFEGRINVKAGFIIMQQKLNWFFTVIDSSNFALKSNFASLKTEVDKLDIDKLIPVPVDLSKLSDTVKNDVKRTVYDKSATKVNNIDTSGFVLKTKYDIDKSELENKIPDTNGVVKKNRL